jgi:hypothetical protein
MGVYAIRWVSSGKGHNRGVGPGPIEVFEVASAIDGVAVEQPIMFGRVFLQLRE